MTKSTIIGNGVGFERTCRVTGYLTKFCRMNSAKQSEVKDRCKHVK